MATTTGERGGRVFDLARLSQQELATRHAHRAPQEQGVGLASARRDSRRGDHQVLRRSGGRFEPSPQARRPDDHASDPKGERKGDTKVWSYPGMEKVVQQMRKKIDGVSKLFTLDACRHGGMTELEEAELTDGQGRALSGHKTAQAYRGYAKETMMRALAATRKRHAHLLAQRELDQQYADGAASPRDEMQTPPISKISVRSQR